MPDEKTILICRLISLLIFRDRARKYWEDYNDKESKRLGKLLWEATSTHGIPYATALKLLKENYATKSQSDSKCG